MKRKLRIAYLFDDSLDRPDGVQQYVRTLGGWMSRRGHLVHYLVGETNSAGTIQPQVRSLSRNVSVRGNQNTLSLPLPASPRTIRRVLRDGAYDVVHVQMPYNPFMSGRVINRLPRSTKLIGTFHIVGASAIERMGTTALGALQKGTLLRFDEIVSVSAPAQRFAHRYYGVLSDVIPNAVSVSSFSSAKPKKFLRPTKHTLLFLGRLVERKGADHLLKALNIMNQQNKLEALTLHLCGDGPMRRELEDYVRDHGLSKNVIFHGFIEESEKADFMASADISIFPSTGGESFGIVLVEAMAAGKSVVLAGNNAGYSSVMDEREEFLFEPSDHRALAEKITRFLDHQTERQKALSWQAARAAEYDVETVAPKLEALYIRA